MEQRHLTWTGKLWEGESLKGEEMSLPGKTDTEPSTRPPSDGGSPAASVKRWKARTEPRDRGTRGEGRAARLGVDGEPGPRSYSTLEGMVVTLAFILTVWETQKRF